MKLAAVELPPPGVGLNTVTRAVVEAAISVALMDALSCPAFTETVVRLDPFHLTTDPLTNPLPCTVKVNAAPPVVTNVGESEVIVGTGLAMVKTEWSDVPPPGDAVNTVTWAVPAAATSSAGMDA